MIAVHRPSSARGGYCSRARLFALAALCALVPTLGSPSPQIVPRDTAVPDIPSLGKLLKGKKKLVVVFLHGVGDHCPGYALEGPDAWISGAGFEQLGIKGPHGTPRTLKTPVSIDRDSGQILVGTDHVNGTPLGNLVTTEESLGTLGDIPVSAVEITWSELTFRLKTKNLDYDFTQSGLSRYSQAMSSPDMSCFKALERPEDIATTPISTPPPSRAMVNRIIKETVLDRALSDALLYTGPFKPVLQRAVAKGLCDAVTLTSTQNLSTSQDDSLCWYNAQQALAEPTDAGNTAYIIFTHSLGSRMAYDLMRNLNQTNRYHDSPFVSGTDDAAFNTFPTLTCHIPAVYMMANQLALLGLAAGGTLEDVIADDPVSQRIRQSERIQADRQKADARALPCNPADGSAGPRFKPQFVAFMDTNDLLSWAIQPMLDHAHFDFFTVFVNNVRWHWFGLYEDAAVAHSGYFNNKNVGRVIVCGSQGGQIGNDCGSAVRH